VDFDDTPDEAEWRTRVRSYLTEQLSELRPHGVTGGEDSGDVGAARRHQQAVLYAGGLVGVTWPAEYGGQGGTPMQNAIVGQERGRLGIPDVVNSIGIGMCGPTIIAHGSVDQQERYLARLLRADDVWCQLFSEPASGSDLAALRTKAERTDDGSWRVNGQKVWTTVAHLADYGILLARTDPSLPKHRGLTMFVVDLHAPGVTVRPLRQMSGSAEFNEVFFDDVLIPDTERLGDVNDGWRVALTTLMNERMSIGGGGSELGAGLAALTALAQDKIPDLPPARQAVTRQAFGQAYIESLAARYTGYRRLTAVSKGEPPGPEGSAGKLAGTAAAVKVADLGVRLLGDDAYYLTAPDGQGRWQHTQAGLPGLAIAGGTDEILRNVIGERVLGLAPEPRADKGQPFSMAAATDAVDAQKAGAR
jgi:alkylation response protein AidB-like acyl-CoA dehydrogenase